MRGRAMGGCGVGLPPDSSHFAVDRLAGTTVRVCYVTTGPFSPAGLGDAGGLELGAVVVPSGAGLVTSSSS
jgi:hypothetical protein